MKYYIRVKQKKPWFRKPYLLYEVCYDREAFHCGDGYGLVESYRQVQVVAAFRTELEAETVLDFLHKHSKEKQNEHS